MRRRSTSLSSHPLARGAATLIGAQVAIAVGQLAFGAVTGRAFSPSVFGGFAAALSLQGVLVVATTAGVPSLALRVDSLGSRNVMRLRLVALAGGAVSAIAFALLAPTWLELLNADEGLVQLPLLTLAQLVGPTAALEMALVRRFAGATWDASLLLASFVLGVTSATAAILGGFGPQALALPVLLQSVAQVIGTRLARRSTSRAERGSLIPLREVFSHTSAATFNASLGSLVGQGPAWIGGGLFGAGPLGQFSRATTMTAMPVNSIATAVVRALSPKWRSVASDGGGAAERDVLVLSASLFMPLSAAIAAMAPLLVPIWLGDGWDPVATFARLLAPAFGFGALALVLSSSAELRGLFRVARQGQLAALGAVAISFGVAAATEAPIAVAVGVLVAQVVSFARSTWLLARAVGASPKRLMGPVMGVAAISGAAGAAAAVGMNVGSLVPSKYAVVASLAAAVLAFACVLLATWRINPLRATARSRRLFGHLAP